MRKWGYLFDLDWHNLHSHWDWENNWSNLILLSDSKNRRYIQHWTQSIGFSDIYDLEEERTILHLQNIMIPPLFMSEPKQSSSEAKSFTFLTKNDDIVTFPLPLEEARKLSEPLTIDPSKN